MTISEKVAYIQGMFVGMELDKSEMKVARVLSEVLDVLQEMGQQLDGMDTAMDQFDEELDTLGDAVAELEEAVFDDEDEADSNFDGGDEDEDFFEIPCPTCGEDLLVDDEALAAGVVDCPACGESSPCPLRMKRTVPKRNKQKGTPPACAGGRPFVLHGRLT